ncbi:unnamed protein product [Phaedon cochleariae]|uniref:Endonuclease-reverse transcriptase n=1 Tax=Phaedon cochleariae TaxID=80249 RepID=A0A9P0DKK9_PHACE|nr:unnamed protein product [Phaedon cochleariae]
MDNELKKILLDLQASSKDIKEELKEIKGALQKQTNKIEQITNKINVLEKDNQFLKEKLKFTERKIKRNNIVIFGIPEEENPLAYFKKTVEEKLEISFEETEVDNIYRIGQIKEGRPRAVILEFVRNLKKTEIFNKVTKFRGTGITISNDLTEEDRKEHNVLYKNLKIAREKQYQAKIKGNKLIVNGEVYTYQQLKEQEEETGENESNNFFRTNSAPSTPTLRNGSDSEETSGCNSHTQANSTNQPTVGVSVKPELKRPVYTRSTSKRGPEDRDPPSPIVKKSK